MKNVQKKILLNQQEYRKQFEFWKEKLSGKIGRIDFLLAYSDSENYQYQKKELSCLLEADTTALLNKITKNNSFNLFVILEAMTKVLLYKYTGQENLAIVTPLIKAASEKEYNEEIILFSELNKDDSVKMLLGKEKKSIVSSCENSLYMTEENQQESEANYGAEDLAYLIYTSGTTGEPKGVAVRNSSVQNYVSWFTDFAAITSKDKGILVSSYAFDLAYTVIFPTLENGAELHILNKDQYTDLYYMQKYIKEKEITYVKMTPSLFKLISLQESKVKDRYMDSLRLVVLGGESIVPADLEDFHDKYPETAFMNHYGPTESTIGCISLMIDFDEFAEFKKNPVLGKPIRNVQIYIHYKNSRLVYIAVSSCT